MYKLIITTQFRLIFFLNSPNSRIHVGQKNKLKNPHFILTLGHDNDV